ncbi:unnamed protein product [Peronospora belbahrii]|uniref:Uncharacterized protein n=1 Tax=Peronospora belbahrii TaxID=622444 RepID=A0ABN8CP30_9STRA|nr:unnamed protein product [Peronospora belbahrii]
MDKMVVACYVHTSDGKLQAIVVKFGSNALNFRENGLSKVCVKFFIAIATTYDDRDKLSKVMNQVRLSCTIILNSCCLTWSKRPMT